jgi:hypothetical protein
VIPTSAAVYGRKLVSSYCDVTVGPPFGSPPNQERAMTYYEVATNTRGRVDLCTGRLQPRWRRAVHTGNPMSRGLLRSEPRRLERCSSRGGKDY